MVVKKCELLYADGDKYVWKVVTENAESFPLSLDLCADGTIWENYADETEETDEIAET